MDKKYFKMLMYALYGNKQLIIPDGQTLQQWIDNAFVEKKKQAINYTHSCDDLKTLKQGEKLILDNKFDVEVVPPSEKIRLHNVVKPFYCKTKRCDKTKTKQCDECALQELNDMQ